MCIVDDVLDYVRSVEDVFTSLLVHSGLVIVLFTSDKMCNVDQEEGS